MKTLIFWILSFTTFPQTVFANLQNVLNYNNNLWEIFLYMCIFILISIIVGVIIICYKIYLYKREYKSIKDRAHKHCRIMYVIRFDDEYKNRKSIVKKSIMWLLTLINSTSNNIQDMIFFDINDNK